MELGGREFQVGMVVVSPLTTEAILGLDFLSAHSATARVKEDTTIPPNCQMEVLARVQGPADSGNWLLEGLAVTAPRKQKEVIVARALVNPTAREIPIRLLNIHNKSVTIAKDTLVATLERLQSEPVVIEAGVSVEQSEMFVYTPSTPPVLAFPDFSREFILDTDASDCGIGGVLSQMDANGRERVIAYGSRTLSKPERQYCVTRRELLAVVAFTEHFRHYLLGQPFTLRTDHGSLTWLSNFKEPTGQLARWLVTSFQFPN